MQQLFASGNPKIIKSDNSDLGYLTKILHLAPASLSGYNVCEWSSPGCRGCCLNKSGRGYCRLVQQARIKKTKLLFEDRSKFRELLYKEINSFVKKCSKLAVNPATRFNGTSDTPIESFFPDIFAGFPQVQFYDYTKSLDRALTQQRPNYHLTFSRTEDNDDKCMKALMAGVNVAVVFSGKLPSEWNGFKVFDGDKNDLRFLDPFGVCGLKAKGRAIYDKTGFVVKGD